MGYSEAKWPFLGRNLKVPKSQQKDSRNLLKFFYAANGSKKCLVFETPSRSQVGSKNKPSISISSCHNNNS